LPETEKNDKAREKVTADNLSALIYLVDSRGTQASVPRTESGTNPNTTLKDKNILTARWLFTP